MKKLNIIVLSLLVILAMGVFFNTSDTAADTEINKEVRLISVSGKGVISAKPDIAFINVGVETMEKDARTAQEKNAQNMDAVIKALKKLGIQDEHITTVRYSLYDRYEYYKELIKEKEKYYVVSNIINVKIEDMDAIGKVIDSVSQAGSNEISNIRFDISNKKELYDKALALAMKDAKKKAASIMKTFDEKPVKPYKILESSYSAPFMRAEMNTIKGMEPPINPGELEIAASLMVEYDY